MDKERKRWNDANIKQVKDVLYEANYQCVNAMKGPNGDMEFFVGHGRANVVLLQYYPGDMGFELYVPLNKSNVMYDTLEDLRVMTREVLTDQTSQSA